MQAKADTDNLLSVWERQVWFAEADLVIAGAGVLGLWTAIEARRRHPKWRVVVVDKHVVPLGASTRNAGFACFGSPGELLSDISRMGLDATLQVVEARWRGIRKIAATFTEAQIGLEWCGGYECVSKEHASGIIGALPDLNRQLQPITSQERIFQLTEDQASFGLGGFGALISNSTEGVLHSGRYLQALADMAQYAGAQLMYGVRIDEAEDGPGGCLLHTNRGKLAAKQLVWATNAALSQQFEAIGIKPGRGQMVLLKASDPVGWHGAFHAHEGYYYWRHLQGCLLLGGGRHTAFDEETTMSLNTSPRIIDHLVEFAHQHFSGKAWQLTDQWAGTMAFTPDKQPLLQEVSENQWVATCCNGMGVALSPVFAETIVKQIGG